MKHLILGMMTLLSFQITIAQEADKTKPGNLKLPSSKEVLDQLAAEEKESFKYSVEDYFEKPKQSDFQFSPNGQFLSYRERDENGKNHIFIKNTESNETLLVLKETEDLIRYYGWANNNRLIYSKDKDGNENYHLFGVDLDGKNNIELTPFSGVRVSFLNDLKNQPDHIIIQMNKDKRQIFEPYKINIKTGALEKLYENRDLFNPISNYHFDKDGNLKAYVQQQKKTEYVLYYRESNDKEFEEVLRKDWKPNFYILNFDESTSNPNDALMISTLDTNTNELIRYDLKEKKKIESLYHNDTFDVANIGISRKRGYEIDYYYYHNEKSVHIPVSETYKKWHARFTKEFGNKQYSIVSMTDAEDKLLLNISSDKLYGIYYLYDLEKDSFIKAFDLMPQLNPADMAEMRPIKFTSRDGLTLYGYLTIPKQVKKGEKVPLIVNPHGGPYGPRDHWGFNPETQLFASRGYATLQINYRGSGGYGKKFFLAGNKQIGRKMLDDLEDGVDYVKQLGFIDKTKIAIYGGSYGGLATLGSLVKTPDLYTCGVDYVGVSNLFTVFKSFPVYWRPYLRQMYDQWYDPKIPEEEKIMKQVSPALNADKITKPLFVIQGANDPRVNINESDQIVENLRKRNFDVPYMVKYNEGHGFGHEENRLELYKTMMGFFSKYLK